MDPLHDPLEGLSPPLYLATLAEVAHVDGLRPGPSKTSWNGTAEYFGVDLNDLPKVPGDLSTLPMGYAGACLPRRGDAGPRRWK